MREIIVFRQGILQEEGDRRARERNSRRLVQSDAPTPKTNPSITPKKNTRKKGTPSPSAYSRT